MYKTAYPSSIYTRTKHLSFHIAQEHYTSVLLPTFIKQSCNLIRTLRARELRKLVLINLIQLRASKVIQRARGNTIKLAQQRANVPNSTKQTIRQELNRTLQHEASEVIPLSERSKVEHSPSQILKVDTSEGINLAGVSTDVQELRILQGGSEEISQEEGDSIFVADSTLIPVLWDTFVAFSPHEVTALSSDREEGFQNLLVKDSFREFGGLVAHEAVDEGVCCGLDGDSGEGGVEEVGVALDGLLKAGGTEGG